MMSQPADKPSRPADKPSRPADKPSRPADRLGRPVERLGRPADIFGHLFGKTGHFGQISGYSAKNRGQRAFTMIEIAIAIAVIAFALVAIIGVLPTGMNVQKDNREDTIINQDGPFFIEAISQGNRGLDYLTNYVESITVHTFGNDPATGAPIADSTVIYTNAPGVSDANYDGSMTNGARIVGILSIPKYVGSDPLQRIENSVVAKVRALTGSATEQGTANPDFAFKYQMTSEVIQYQGSQVPVASTNFNDNTISGTPEEIDAEKARRNAEWVRVTSRQNDSAVIKLTFRWPLFQGDQTGPGRQSFRTLVSGARTKPIDGFTYFQPQIFAAP
jgi:prepilin-type N-terminal cleavage/methylation domain-containing protein